LSQGGKPSPFDRMLAARFGVMCAEKLMTQILEYANVAGMSILLSTDRVYGTILLRRFHRCQSRDSRSDHPGQSKILLI